jgi:hypothetical protein
MKKIYVGLKPGFQEIFRSETEPTPQTHTYNACIGPFRTVRGAKAMIHYGHSNNPHIRCVRDAERIGKKYADDLKSKPLTNLIVS